MNGRDVFQFTSVSPFGLKNIGDDTLRIAGLHRLQWQRKAYHQCQQASEETVSLDLKARVLAMS